MTSISSLSGPRVQPATTNTTQSVSGSRFGSLMQGVSGQAPKAGATLTGGSVVASALAQAGAQPHGALTGTYTAGIQSQNADTRQQTGEQPAKSEEQQALEDLAQMSAVSLSQSILHMGGMNVELERE